MYTIRVQAIFSSDNPATNSSAKISHVEFNVYVLEPTAIRHAIAFNKRDSLTIKPIIRLQYGAEAGPISDFMGFIIVQNNQASTATDLGSKEKKDYKSWSVRERTGSLLCLSLSLSHTNKEATAYNYVAATLHLKLYQSASRMFKKSMCGKTMEIRGSGAPQGLEEAALL